MACASGPFFRQLDTIVVNLHDPVAVPISVPMIAFSWWQVGKRLIFDVPARGILYSDTTFTIRFRDPTALAYFTIGSMTLLAGTETESFRLICDVVEISNSTITLKCWLDYPFSIGLDPAPVVFSTVTFNSNFHPLETQIYLDQHEEVESEITFQNIQFSGLPKTALLIC